MQISKTDSESITIMRALALTSVVSAHTASVVLEDRETVFCSDILSAFGSIGVIVFFIISGYLFELHDKSGKVFWKSKLVMIIPWVVCGTMDYLYTALRRDGISVINWISFLTIHSHYCYMSLLFILYAFYRITRHLFKNSVMVHYVLIVLSLISILLTEHWIIKIYPYINFMNWVAYFSFGCILAHTNCVFSRRVSNINAGKWGIAIVFLLVGYNITFQKPLSYWSPLSSMMIIILAYFMWNTTLSIKRNNETIKNIFLLIGKYSFPIYLCHMPFAGVITNLTNRLPYLGVLVFLRPILVVGITFFCLRLFECIAKRFHVEKWYRLCIGIR